VPAERGERIMRDIIELVSSGAIRPVIGRVVGFDEIPNAIEAMANRETVGRTVVVVR
jgi:NADPH2:quinone reductase